MINISVIIPNYNHGQYLKERIDSILNQTYNNFEIIILDDASTDNSKEIIEKYRNNKFVSAIIYSETNSGSPFNQWVKGIKLAKYEWIWIAESDDLASKHFLEEAVITILQNKDIGFYYCNSLIENNDKYSIATSDKSKTLLHRNDWDNNYIVNGLEEINSGLKYFSNIPNCSAVLMKTNYVVKHLAIIQNFKYCGDWYLYISILKEAKVAYNKNILNIFRRTPISHSVINWDKDIKIKKIELFKTFKLIYKTIGVTNKNKILKCFIKHHIGLGFKSEGLFTLIQIIFIYFRIDFYLTCQFLWERIFIKFSSKNQKL